MQPRVRPRKIAQALNIRHRQRRVHHRLGVRRKKIARLGRMPVSPQRDVKRLFNRRRRSGHIQHQPVAVSGGDSQAVRPRKIFHRLVILFRRAEPGGEFFRRQKLAKVRAGRVINLRQESRPSPPHRAAAARWPAATGSSPAAGLSPSGSTTTLWHMTGQNLPIRAKNRNNSAKQILSRSKKNVLSEALIFMTSTTRVTLRQHSTRCNLKTT